MSNMKVDPDTAEALKRRLLAGFPRDIEEIVVIEIYEDNAWTSYLRVMLRWPRLEYPVYNEMG